MFLQVWTVYDGGPKTIKTPLICLPPGIKISIVNLQILKLD